MPPCQEKEESRTSNSPPRRHERNMKGFNNLNSIAKFLNSKRMLKILMSMRKKITNKLRYFFHYQGTWSVRVLKRWWVGHLVRPLGKEKGINCSWQTGLNRKTPESWLHGWSHVLELEQLWAKFEIAKQSNNCWIRWRPRSGLKKIHWCLTNKRKTSIMDQRLINYKVHQN